MSMSGICAMKGNVMEYIYFFCDGIFLHQMPSNKGNIFLQLVTQQCCFASCDCLLPVLPPPRATNFLVAKSSNIVYFLQHENESSKC